MSSPYNGIFYPPAVPVPTDTPGATYSRPALKNPTLSGFPLGLLSSLVTILPPLQSIFYSNAGFKSLRDLDIESSSNRGILREYTPRWDPTVIPTGSISDNVGNALRAFNFGSSSSKPNSAEGYTRKYVEGTVSPMDVANCILALVDRKKEKGKRGLETAWMMILRDEVLKGAKESATRWEVERSRSRGEYVEEGKEGVRWIDLGNGRRGCLDGVFIGVKDEILVQNHSLTCGTGRKQNVPNASSWAVQKLQDYGAIVVGTTVMHEFGLDTTNNNPTLGAPINPFSPDYYSGGSSGGSGSVVGCGIVPIALGADGGGSIRIPAAYCGAYGLKPSHGRISGYPVLSHCVSTGVLGPIAATMQDLETSYKVMAIPNPDDPVSAHFPNPVRPIPSPTTAPIRKKYLGVDQDWFNDSAPEVQRICNDAIQHLVNQEGYELVDIQIPFVRHGQLAHALTILNEVSSGFIQGLEGWKRWVTPATKLLVAVMQQSNSRDLLLAQKVRSLLMSHLSHLFQTYPGLIIVTPTLPDPLGSGLISSAADVQVGGYGITNTNRSLESMRYVFLANYTGCPAISLPVGYTSIPPAKKEMKEMSVGVYQESDAGNGGGRFPVALMGMAEWGCEEELLRLGYEGERYLDGIKVAEEGGSGVRMPSAWVDVLGRSESSST